MKRYWLIFVFLFVVLYPSGPLEFTSPRLDFFRAWLFLFLPMALCWLIIKSTTSAERKPERVGSLAVVVPIAFVCFFLAIWNSSYMASVITESRDHQFRLLRSIHAGRSSVVIYERADFFTNYIDIRQEWAILPELKLVRCIDEIPNDVGDELGWITPNDVNNTTVEDHTIKYGWGTRQHAHLW